MQPGFGVSPIAAGGSRRKVERRRRFFQAESREIAKFDELCYRGVLLSQLPQRLVNGQDIVRSAGSTHGVQFCRDTLKVASLPFGLFAPSGIDQDSPHGFRRGAKEVSAAVPI